MLEAKFDYETPTDSVTFTAYDDADTIVIHQESANHELELTSKQVRELWIFLGAVLQNIRAT